MASRPVVPQQIRGDEAIGGGKQVKGGAAVDARNRRALGDIGNLVTVRGNDAKANRPVTRSFCAQLLANAQAAAKAENNKKLVPVSVDGAAPILNDGIVAVRKPRAPKAAPKKVVSKPKAEVIEISPDTVEKDRGKEVKCGNKKKEGEGVSKKKAQTLTAVMTARSKAACGVTKKPKEQTIDIDAADVGNELAEVEYVEDIYKFYKEVENESRPHDYMDSQPEINASMRAILVDWLVDVHNKFELSPETFYLTINIIDRFLARKAVPRRELQLLGIGAMLIASKYEEIWAPEVNDFVCLSDRAYTNEQILMMEKRILGKLEWTMTVPTPYVFLARFIKASKDSDHEMENLVYFLAELGIMHYNTSIMYSPSMIAASAVYAARCTLKKSPGWDETLKLHTGFTEPQLIDCAKHLVGFHGAASKNKLQVIYRKYSSSERGAVALLQPPKALLVVPPNGH
ncbi:G2/mitotic-specific cyclin S13-7-like [Cucurbita moschata]|uniref:B-like cyclin n=1 Tax=Cucurbita moschata TaxID=3662 RepID=A0A6J1EAK2_CUCMO|nr:G2/mitotic-specific cyclin S13-7-like [Cucurbita moschata]